MNVFLQFFRSTVGQKILMAVTGICLVGFLIGHLAGNVIQFFRGADAMNHYAHTLQSLGSALWVIRLVLLSIFVLHIFLAVRLALKNTAARPIAYSGGVSNQVSSLASRTMFISGVLVFAFVVYHLLHFTILPQPTLTAEGHPNVFQLMVDGYRNPIVSASYIVAMLVLAFHGYHALTSFFQTLGFNHPKYNACFKRIGVVFALFLFVGFSSIPVSVWLNIFPKA